MVHHKISELILKQLRGEISDVERTELQAWTQSSPENKALYEELTTEETLAAEVKNMDGIKTRILEAITSQVPGQELGIRNRELGGKVVPLYKRKAFRWIAAASIIVVIGIATYTVISKRSEKSPAAEVAQTNDVEAPKETRAVITLANGSKVYLDSVNNGTIAQESNVAVVKNESGEIEYRGQKSDVGSTIAFNTLFNPRGSKVISLTLGDGTRVWLNSESSLKYPIAFAGNTREVEITGEAYFEVKHNAKQPFKVHLPNGSVVEDIGTAFNINAYSDEQNIKTTLIEGSVRVKSEVGGQKSERTLIPGQQASISNPANPLIHKILVADNVDIDEVVAWKNGRFEFGGQAVDAVMRQLSRWYDVEIVYEGTKPSANFRGSISRQENVGEVLKMLELTKAVKFRIDGKKIIVSK